MTLTDRREVSHGVFRGIAGNTCPEPFAVEVIVLPGETVLILHGELDINTQHRFAEALDSVGEAVGPLILDLSDLAFIDCGNIGLIHRSRNRAELRGTCLELRGLSVDSPSADADRPISLPLPARAYDRPRDRELHGTS